MQIVNPFSLWQISQFEQIGNTKKRTVNQATEDANSKKETGKEYVRATQAKTEKERKGRCHSKCIAIAEEGKEKCTKKKKGLSVWVKKAIYMSSLYKEVTMWQYILVSTTSCETDVKHGKTKRQH